MPHALLIVNPAARGGRSAESEALAAFARAGLEVRLERTRAPGHAAELAALAVDGEPVFVLGGDGTVMDVVGALVGRDIPVGVIPGGTGNQLARHLGIPLDASRAVAALVRARPQRFDLGRLREGRYFALAAGLGVDAAMIAGASPAAKRRFGVGAYVVSAAKALVQARPFPVRVEVDGQVFEREAGLAMIANVGSVMNGRFALGPGIRHDDGLLDACILSPRALTDGVALAARMALRRFGNDSRMLFVRGREIRIEAPAGTQAEADGELLAGPTLAATVVPYGATFLAVPPK